MLEVKPDSYMPSPSSACVPAHRSQNNIRVRALMWEHCLQISTYLDIRATLGRRHHVCSCVHSG
eukprot:CAMPEP_0197927962 /NCGR_PEP_ID=MMETSP1439-20131203/101548_1 /TAXON_ID=66791 /ORGANISM="Gonyaulax spinifera, Strain CCMP409" /LENGTH=63 /DNA_ID=CAMNT_0043550553 /DNA_START=179 /DNA_END=366 /DNA_ORIENTATION=-